jgi:hypothetical protein
VKAGVVDTEFGKSHTISCKTWLAPFDLGVSQMVTLSTEPTAMEDVFEVNLRITRESGDISNWKRVNRQFLIWRTMHSDERDKYLTAAASPAPATAAEPEAAPA